LDGFLGGGLEVVDGKDLEAGVVDLWWNYQQLSILDILGRH
jgi:hypothetical protein